MFLRAAFAALCLAGSLHAQQPELPAPLGKLVDIGGRRLHLLCSGQGSPTVVLEAGASAFAIDWTLVQRELERTNRVCSYDRAGMGWSDVADGTKRRSDALDLHTLLSTAGERAPYVLVGASRGGLLVRAYVADYPNDVVGLVLVDPASEDRLWTMVDGNALLLAALTPEQLRATHPRGPVSVPRRRPQVGAPFDRLPAELYQLRIELDERLIASVPETVAPDVVARSQEQEHALLARLLASRSTPYPLGDRPTVVLSRSDERDTEREAVHAGLARLATNSRHTVVPGAGHEIHLFQPAAVLQAVTDVLQAVRSKTPLPKRRNLVPRMVTMNLIKQLEATRDETLRYFALPEADLARTYAPGKWPVRYILLHLADSDTVFYDRIRRVLSEPRQVLWVYDQDAWATGLDYSRVPLDIARPVYESVRNAIIYYAGRCYEAKGHLEFVHSVTGVRTLKDEFDKVAWHNEHHLSQIRTALSLPSGE